MSENHNKSREESEREIEELKLRIIELELIKRQYTWAEERLRSEKERAQMYLDIAGAIILVLDTEGKVVLINRKGSEVLGHPQKEIVGKSWIDNFLPLEDREQAKRIFHAIVCGNLKPNPFDYYENPVLTKKGDQRNILWRNNVIRDDSGRVISTLSSGEDITERKNAEEARLQNLEFYRSLIKASPDAIVLFDLDFKTIMVNQRAAGLFNFIQKEEAIGRYAFEFISARDRSRAEKDIRELIKKETILASEYELVKANGSRFCGEISGSIIRDAHGQIKALMCVIRDVTQRKQAEVAIRQALVKESAMQTLQESRDYLDKIINSVADPIFVKDREHKWVLLNDACCKFMGYRCDQLIGKSDYDYFPKREADVFWNRDEIVFGTGKENINEEEFTDSKGVTHSIITKKALYCDSQKNQFIVGIIRDVTELKKAEKERFKREKVETELKERKKSEAKLLSEKNFSDSVINSLPGVFYVFDKKGSFLRWNKNLVKITGYSDSEIAKMSPMDFFDPLEKKLVSQKIEEVFIKGSSNVESYLITKTGEKKPYYFTGLKSEIAGTICLVGVGMDIAERRKAEEALRSSEQKYRDLVENVNDIIYSLDTKGRVTSVNEAVKRMLGFEPEELIGRKFTEYVHKQDLPEAKAAFKRVLEGEAFTTETVIIDKEGDQHKVEFSTTPIIKDKRIVGTRGIIRDITARKRIEERLAELNACFLEFGSEPIENITRLVNLCGRLMGGTCALYNRIDQGMLCSIGQWNVPADYSLASDPKGRICYDLIQNYNDQLMVVRDLENTIYAKTDPYVKKYKLKTYVGISVKFINSQIGSLCVVYQKDFIPAREDAWLMGVISSAIAVEEDRRDAEEARRESERKMSTLLANTPDLIISIDRQGKILFINRAGLDLTVEDTIGKCIYDYLTPEYREIYKDTVEEVFQTGEKNALECSAAVSENILSWYESRFAPVVHNNEVVSLIVIITDISEHRKNQALAKERAERVIKHQKILLELAKVDCFDLDAAFKKITETVSKTLNVERVGIWLFNEDYNAISCEDLYSFTDNTHQSGMKLLARDYPRYFSALEESRSIAADDACSDLRTSEFKDDYLKTYSIASMLDVPIRLHGKVVGVVCHEHTGEKRSWSLEEDEFASSVADSISLLLAACKRRLAEKALEKSEATLDGVLRAVPIAIGLATDRVLGWTNKGLHDMLGYSSEELQGKSARILYESDTEYKRVGQVKYGQIDKYGSGSVLTRWKRKDGSMIDIWLSSTHLFSKDPPKGLVFTAMDLTERMKAERFLSESEKKYRTLVDNLNVGVFRNTPDPGGYFIHANPAMIKMLGYTNAQEFMKVKVRDLYQKPDDRDAFLDEVKKRGFVKDKELNMVKKNGTEIIISCTAKAQLGPKGNIKWLDGITEDVTDRKKIEKARIFTQFVVDQMNDVALWIDYKGNICYVNEAATKELGYSKVELLKKTIHDIDTSLPKDTWQAQWEEAKREKTKTFETVFRTKDKLEFPVEISGNFIQFAGNEYVCAIVRDISERERAEEVLRRSEHDKTTILNSLSELVVYHDTKMKILWANRAAGDDAGVNCEQLTGKSCHEVWQGRRLACKGCPVKKALKSKKFEQGDVISPDGQSWFIRAYPIRDLNSKISGVVEVALNTTQQKNAEKESRLNFERSRRILEETVMALAATAERRDPYTAGHQRRVSQLACAIAKEIGLENEQIEGVRMASIIHDVGKVYVPSEILSKPSSLTDLEFSIIKTHPQIGYEILQPVEFPWPVAMIVLQHHERLDGSGYPHGVSNEDILLETKIITVADVVEAMASHRPYRAAKGINSALKEITQNKDIFYDSGVVSACIKLFKKKKFKFD